MRAGFEALLCPQIVVKTPKASYVCTRPATSYRKIFTHLTEQADIALEVICSPSFCLQALYCSSIRA